VVLLIAVLMLLAGAKVYAETGTIRLDGSTTLYPAFAALGKRFMELHPGITVVNEQSSSGQSVRMLIDGQIDIARVARELKMADLEAARATGKNLRMFQVGFDVIAIVVHPSKSKYVKQLTKEQAWAIFFAGTITDWAQLNPALSGKINVYVRDLETSGVAAAFAEMVTGSEDIPQVAHGIEVDFTPDLRKVAVKDKDAITYLPASFIDESVAALAYGPDEGSTVPISPATVRNRSYQLNRDLYIATISTPTGVNCRFIDFALSREGQRIIKQNGLTPVR
jgi:phosphate transport system substrate-binding protein